jgi:hypothetical protein
MQFGLVEVQIVSCAVAHDERHGAVPDTFETGASRTHRGPGVGISLVFEKVGQSVLRNRDVVTIP